MNEKLHKKDPFEAFRKRKLAEKTEREFIDRSRRGSSSREVSRRIVRRQETRLRKRSSMTERREREEGRTPPPQRVEDIFGSR